MRDLTPREKELMALLKKFNLICPPDCGCRGQEKK